MFIFLLHPKSVFRNSFFTQRERERDRLLYGIGSQVVISSRCPDHAGP